MWFALLALPLESRGQGFTDRECRKYFYLGGFWPEISCLCGTVPALPLVSGEPSSTDAVRRVAHLVFFYGVCLALLADLWESGGPRATDDVSRNIPPCVVFVSEIAYFVFFVRVRVLAVRALAPESGGQSCADGVCEEYSSTSGF